MEASHAVLRSGNRIIQSHGGRIRASCVDADCGRCFSRASFNPRPSPGDVCAHCVRWSKVLATENEVPVYHAHSGNQRCYALERLSEKVSLVSADFYPPKMRRWPSHAAALSTQAGTRFTVAAGSAVERCGSTLPATSSVTAATVSVFTTNTYSKGWYMVQEFLGSLEPGNHAKGFFCKARASRGGNELDALNANGLAGQGAFSSASCLSACGGRLPVSRMAAQLEIYFQRVSVLWSLPSEICPTVTRDTVRSIHGHGRYGVL